MGASDPDGDPLTERQQGQLIHASDGLIAMRAPLDAEYRTDAGLVLFLTRLPGAFGYPGCD